MTKLVYGVGINERKYPTKVNGKKLKEYDVWKNLLKRCYCPMLQKERPTYIGCSASENFKSYSYFYQWCQDQVGFGQEGYHLDKDVLLRGNRIYSENTCVFLPSELNALLTARKNCRGVFPIGVSAYYSKFKAKCCTDKSSDFLGIFNNLEEAFQAYKQAKEAYIKSQAEKWKNFIDLRAYEALMHYEVQITD